MRKVSLTRMGAYVGFSAAVALVVTLAVQNRRLEAAYVALIERATSPHAGYRVPWVPVRTLAGESLTLGAPEAGGVQVLFFYTTTCPHCRATVPAWSRIAKRAGDAAVLGIQLDWLYPAAAYRDSMGLTYTVVPLDSAVAVRVADWYRVRGVPLTLVVGPDGRVGYVRRGRIVDSLTVDSVLTAVEVATRSGG